MPRVKIPPIGTFVYLVWEDSGIGSNRENVSPEDLKLAIMECAGWIVERDRSRIVIQHERDKENNEDYDRAIQGGISRKNIIQCVSIPLNEIIEAERG